MVKVDLSGAEQFLKKGGIDYSLAAEAHKILAEGTGAGADFRGWMAFPRYMKEHELDRIIAAAEKIRARSKALVVIGIGGSYLGARGAIELLRPNPAEDDPQVFFVGNGLSSDYLCDLLDRLGDKDFDVNVISKSGTTLEPAVGFRIFRELLAKKYGADADKHIFATTDAARGVLKGLANENGWESFVIPDDIGGRFSVLTAVGLLPMAVAGMDITEVMFGAASARRDMEAFSFENPAWLYAAARNLLYRRGKKTELFCSYEPDFRFMGGWLQQLFGESEGKDGKGIYPFPLEFTADLHSMGQMIQQGERTIFETVLRFAPPRKKTMIESDWKNLDGLNYLEGKSLDFVEEQAFQGTLAAHTDGGVPVILVQNDEICDRTLGEMFYFFELSCGISAYMLGVNPFNQPGVEFYKRNMFQLLGKPGYEQ